MDQKEKDLKFVTEESLIKDLEILDGIIYKEGREKRAKQNLKESLIGCIRNNSADYDAMMKHLTEMKKMYTKMTKWCNEYAPELLEEMSPEDEPDFERLPDFEKKMGFYDKVMGSDMLKN